MRVGYAKITRTSESRTGTLPRKISVRSSIAEQDRRLECSDWEVIGCALPIIFASALVN